MDAGPHVLVVYDQAGWAFDRISQQISQRLSDEFHISRLALADWRLHGNKYRRAYFKPFRAAIFLTAQAIDLVKRKMLPESAKLIVCQYDDVLWRRNKADAALLRSAMLLCDVALFGNRRLQDVLASEIKLPTRVGLCEDGVDTQLFTATEYPSGWDSGPLLVGWAGNSDETWFGNIKGLRDLQSAVAAVPGVELVMADRRISPIAYVHMPTWYRGIHLYLCWSTSEGTPNPILEASSTGRAWVAPCVGICPDLLSRHAGCVPPGWIVRRDQAVLCRTLRYLRDHRELLPLAGQAGAAAIRNSWDWSVKVEQFRDALRRVLSSGKEVKKCSPRS